jgi:GNAT superfamily N-acetyltransferase
MSADLDIIVRRAEPNDQKAVYPLARELATSFEPSGTAFAESFSDLISDRNALVLVAVEEHSREVIGYLLGFRHKTFFANGPVGWVEEVHTRADSRQAGVARALMAEFESLAWESGARLVALATRRARSFYKAIGYEESAVYFRKLAPG